MSTRSRAIALTLVTGAVLVLSGCSSSPSPSASSTTTSSHGTTTTTTQAATTSSTSTSTTSAAGASACTKLSAAAGQSQGAAGTITGVIDLTNTAATSCTVSGYPKLNLYATGGGVLTVTMVDGLSVQLSPAANGAPTTLHLAPAAVAQFAYQYSDVPSGTETTCPSSATATVTAPGSSTPTPSFSFSIAPCDNGTVRVSPLYSP